MCSLHMKQIRSSLKLSYICITTLEQFEKVNNLWAVLLCANHLLDVICTLHAFQYIFLRFIYKKLIDFGYELHFFSVWISNFSNLGLGTYQQQSIL